MCGHGSGREGVFSTPTLFRSTVRGRSVLFFLWVCQDAEYMVPLLFLVCFCAVTIGRDMFACVEMLYRFVGFTDTGGFMYCIQLIADGHIWSGALFSTWLAALVPLRANALS